MKWVEVAIWFFKAIAKHQDECTSMSCHINIMVNEEHEKIKEYEKEYIKE